MAKHLGLLSSLVASAFVTLAASSAQAQTALEWTQQLADNVTPDANTWGGTPCAISWGPTYSANTNGACLFTLSLKKADPTITNSWLTFFFGSANPASNIYHDHILAGNHFTNITNFADSQPGDLLASKYASSAGDTGYLMILADRQDWGTSNGVKRYLIRVLDSTRSPHGETDTRWNADAGAHDWGVGEGWLYLDTDEVTGAVLGHTWSATANGSYYTQEQRHLVVGRFFR